PGNFFALPQRFTEMRPPPGRERQEMRRSLRSTRWLAVAVAAGCAAIATVVTTSTPAAVRAPAGGHQGRVLSASHRCLVMTGSGDVTFIKNFNPFTATGLPSGQFIQGSFYEPLIITGEG